GGILKYLEQTDGAHWQGDCFVFDGRGAVDKRLRPAQDAGA
ncbi:MAG TPA: sulfurtransferase, partial [Rhodanobacter sp.]|nr:sulfurtransferase [Rhodanobacter sp.]